MQLSRTARRLAAGALVVLAAALGLAVLQQPASAHGSLTDPQSRNYGC